MEIKKRSLILMATNVQRYAVKCPGCGVVLYYTPFRTKAAFCPFCRRFFISGKHEHASMVEDRFMPNCLSCYSKRKVNIKLEPLDDDSMKCPNCSLKYSYVKHELMTSPLPEEIYPFRVSRKLAAKLMATWLMNNDIVPEDVLDDFLPEFIDAVYIPVHVFEGEARCRWEIDVERHGRVIPKKGKIKNDFRVPIQGCLNTPDILNNLFCLSLEDKVTDVKPLKDLDDFAHVPILSFDDDIDRVYNERVFPSIDENFRRQAKTKAGLKPDSDVKVNMESQVKRGLSRTYYLPFWIVTYRYHGNLYKCSVDGFKGIYCGGDIPKKKLVEEKDVKNRRNFFIGVGAVLLAIVLFAVKGIQDSGTIKSSELAYYLYLILPTTAFAVIMAFRFLPQLWAIYDSKKRRQRALGEFLAFYRIAGVVELDYNVEEEKTKEQEKGHDEE